MPDPAAPDPLDDFVALSAILTGIAPTMLHPLLDTHGTAEAYLTYALQNAEASPVTPAPFTKLMDLYAQNRTQPPSVIANLIMTASDPDVLYIAKTVMLMWYLGAWYEPAALASYQQAALGANPPAFPPPSVVISSDAYTQGWAWRVGQTHPMGYSDLRFGYWNAPPLPLKDFVEPQP